LAVIELSTISAMAVFRSYPKLLTDSIREVVGMDSS